ncbi:hypothetical protein ACRALDRAFT_1082026, partial [Sodiomyces alcalophilus JCM 7366]|uniref:uncharacterized protein n=1 Tax=Sodiomyces alcalophilus JCM 7366 TaxID=591952 RepID=UPI0039B5B2C7
MFNIPSAAVTRNLPWRGAPAQHLLILPTAINRANIPASPKSPRRSPGTSRCPTPLTIYYSVSASRSSTKPDTRRQ